MYVVQLKVKFFQLTFAHHWWSVFERMLNGAYRSVGSRALKTVP